MTTKPRADMAHIHTDVLDALGSGTIAAKLCWVHALPAAGTVPLRAGASLVDHAQAALDAASAIAVLPPDAAFLGGAIQRKARIQLLVLDAIERATGPTASGMVADLAMLVRRLIRIINRNDPGNTVATQAMDYLQRKGLEGSPLRSDTMPSTPFTATEAMMNAGVRAANLQPAAADGSIGHRQIRAAWGAMQEAQNAGTAKVDLEADPRLLSVLRDVGDRKVGELTVLEARKLLIENGYVGKQESEHGG